MARRSVFVARAPGLATTDFFGGAGLAEAEREGVVEKATRCKSTGLTEPSIDFKDRLRQRRHIEDAIAVVYVVCD